MKRLAQVISFLALGLTAAGPALFFYDQLSLGQTQGWLLVGAIIWLLATPFWMEHKTG